MTISKAVSWVSSHSTFLAYIPFVSSFHGIGKIVKGLGMVADSEGKACMIAKSVFEKEVYRNEGWKKVGRGTIELIPVVGNLILIYKDTIGQQNKPKRCKRRILTDAELNGPHIGL